MTASIGSLLASTAQGNALPGNVPLWRATYHVTDERAKVGRPFGDGSVAQGRGVIRAIIDTALAWVKKTARVVDADGKTHKLRWDVMHTLEAVLGFIDFKTGEIIATYDMIARKANVCRLTAIRHLAFLRKLKWIDWVRRSEPGGNGEKASWAPNAYFFEADRLPLDAQIHLRQILKRMGIKLASHPERRGSGPVPNRAQRLVERIAKGFATAAERMRSPKRQGELMDEAAFVRAEMLHFGDVPAEQWAAIRHPADAAAQEAYNRRLGIRFAVLPSNGSAPDSGVQKQE